MHFGFARHFDIPIVGTAERTIICQTGKYWSHTATAVAHTGRDSQTASVYKTVHIERYQRWWMLEKYCRNSLLFCSQRRLLSNSVFSYKSKCKRIDQFQMNFCSWISWSTSPPHRTRRSTLHYFRHQTIDTHIRWPGVKARCISGTSSSMCVMMWLINEQWLCIDRLRYFIV